MGMCSLTCMQVGFLPCPPSTQLSILPDLSVWVWPASLSRRSWAPFTPAHTLFQQECLTLGGPWNNECSPRPFILIMSQRRTGAGRCGTEIQAKARLTGEGTEAGPVLGRGHQLAGWWQEDSLQLVAMLTLLK